MEYLSEKLRKTMQTAKQTTGINKSLTLSIFSFAICSFIITSCGKNKEEKKVYESDYEQVEKNSQTSFSEFGDFDFTNRIPGGALVLEKRIPTPWFLASQFKRINVIPPDSVLVNYWKDKKGKPAGMLKQVQFIETLIQDDTLVTFNCNEKTRISFVEKYSEGLNNTMRGFANIYGDEIVFEEHFGQMKETTKFIKVGQQLITLNDVGNQLSEYEIKVNDKKIKSGTDDTFMLISQDSIIALLQ